jgi:hypothetical protein
MVWWYNIPLNKDPYNITPPSFSNIRTLRKYIEEVRKGGYQGRKEGRIPRKDTKKGYIKKGYQGRLSRKDTKEGYQGSTRSIQYYTLIQTFDLGAGDKEGVFASMTHRTTTVIDIVHAVRLRANVALAKGSTVGQRRATALQVCLRLRQLVKVVKSSQPGSYSPQSSVPCSQSALL